MRTEWRVLVGYAPKDLALFDATVAQNAALRRGIISKSITYSQHWRKGSFGAWAQSAMAPWGRLSVSAGYHSPVGCARAWELPALNADSAVFVMGEATSAVDTQTESIVTDAITSLGEESKKVVVAHRMLTIKNFDRIYFMSDASIIRGGTLEDLVCQFPGFAGQAHQSGLV